MPGKRAIHTAKWDRCVQKVGAKSVANPYAICSSSLGRAGTFRKSSLRGGKRGGR